jgi:hypothetical protein
MPEVFFYSIAIELETHPCHRSVIDPIGQSGLIDLFAQPYRMIAFPAHRAAC